MLKVAEIEKTIPKKIYSIEVFNLRVRIFKIFESKVPSQSPFAIVRSIRASKPYHSIFLIECDGIYQNRSGTTTEEALPFEEMKMQPPFQTLAERVIEVIKIQLRMGA